MLRGLGKLDEDPREDPRELLRHLELGEGKRREWGKGGDDGRGDAWRWVGRVDDYDGGVIVDGGVSVDGGVLVDGGVSVDGGEIVDDDGKCWWCMS